MKSHQKPDNRASARLFSLMLVLVLVLSLVPAAVFAADSYTAVAKGSVSWTMINQNPDTFYTTDSSGSWCAISRSWDRS